MSLHRISGSLTHSFLVPGQTFFEVAVGVERKPAVQAESKVLYFQEFANQLISGESLAFKLLRLSCNESAVLTSLVVAPISHLESVNDVPSVRCE